MNKKDFSTKEAKKTLQLAFEQMQEDRETIRESYDKFADQMDNLNDYAVNGANVNKCLELLTKQTAQLLELAKIQGSLKKDEEENITEEDQKDIYNSLRSVQSGNK